MHNFTKVFSFFVELGCDVLIRKEILCRELLNLADVLDPGMSRLRGYLMWELQLSIAHIAHRKLSNKELVIPWNEEELKNQLEDARNMAEEGGKILAQEAPDSQDYNRSKEKTEKIQNITALLDKL